MADYNTIVKEINTLLHIPVRQNREAIIIIENCPLPMKRR